MLPRCNDWEDRKRGGGWGKLKVVRGGGKDSGMRTTMTIGKNDERLLEVCELSVRGDDDDVKTMKTTTTKKNSERWLKGNDLGDRV